VSGTLYAPEPTGSVMRCVPPPTGYAIRSGPSFVVSCEDVMTTFTDSLRGYALAVLRRDGFRCRYCGLDGTESFANWVCLSWDHLLPKAHLERDNPTFIVASCMFCNTADNRYFDLAEKRGLRFEGLTPEELVAQRRPYVEATRNSYREFWEQQVRAST
jgi:hypothetical protein